MSGARLQDGFDHLAQWLNEQRAALRASGQILFAAWSGEHSDFVRFNHARVRQAGSVHRYSVTLRLIQGQRSASLTVTLSADAGSDAQRLSSSLRSLRHDLTLARDDPFLLYDRNDGDGGGLSRDNGGSFASGATASSDTPSDPAASRGVNLAPPPAPQAVVDAVAQSAAHIGDADLVGFYSGGPMARGLLSSLGHHFYHPGSSWVFDFSLFSPLLSLRDKAVKAQVSGIDWSADRLVDSVRQAAEQVPLLAMAPRRLSPGRYRTLLSPSACADLVGTLGWGGFSARALRTGQSALGRLHAGSVTLDPRVNLSEDLVAGQVPRFQDSGFYRPGRIDLIGSGRLLDTLVSPRTAREFELASNAANSSESPEALCMAAGDLPHQRLLEHLGTGLAVSNLWYLNYSDRDDCRVTGMTRFATMWVEDGQPVAPVDVMRFDDSVFDLLGAQLEGLGDVAQWLPNTDTYEWRGFGGVSVPAVLLRQMSFTL